jgi:hypothetical protein
MIETNPFKSPPAAPIDVALEDRTHPSIYFGRNTSLAKVGKEFNKD